MVKCTGCCQQIHNNERLKCSLCKKIYDLQCANVVVENFNIMTMNLKNIWKCQECKCKMPKTDNTNTPIRVSQQQLTDMNVTMRRKPTNQEPSKDNSENDISIDDIIGNTINNVDISFLPNNQTNSTGEPLTLEKISSLLDIKLENIKVSLLQDIKNTIQGELNNSIKKLQYDVELKTNNIIEEQTVINEKICKVEEKIKKIEQQLYSLETPKKIVLYGLNEKYHETECDLFDRVSQAFQEIMNININPYIEEIKRIGRYGDRRPLSIELISKRMAKYITENAREFRNTGLAVGPFLDKETLQNRNQLKYNLQMARKNGDFAIIKNNKLFINGNEYKSTALKTKTLKNSDTSNIIDNSIITSKETITQSQPTTQIFTQPQHSNISQQNIKSNQTFRWQS